MANPEHVELVRAGTVALNAWRAANPATRLDLSGADLRRIELTAEKLPGPETSVEKLPDGTAVLYINERSADLSEVNLAGKQLTGADLTYVDLTGADLQEASLRGVCLARNR